MRAIIATALAAVFLLGVSVGAADAKRAQGYHGHHHVSKAKQVRRHHYRHHKATRAKPGGYRAAPVRLVAIPTAEGGKKTRQRPPHGETAKRFQSGIASVYSTREGSSRTASGIRLRDDALTAAHRTLPFGTRVNVTNSRNGRSVIVTISDRGPFVRGRIIDLTPAGARALGFSGLAPVTVEPLARTARAE
jgi:rare lipoprotein A